MTRPQTPGRREALRAVLANGTASASLELMRLAGLGREIQRAPPPPFHGTIAPFSSGVDKLTAAERAALPF